MPKYEFVILWEDRDDYDSHVGSELMYDRGSVEDWLTSKFGGKDPDRFNFRVFALHREIEVEVVEVASVFKFKKGY